MIMSNRRAAIMVLDGVPLGEPEEEGVPLRLGVIVPEPVRVKLGVPDDDGVLVLPLLAGNCLIFLPPWYT